MNGHCCCQNWHEKIDERHQHSSGAKKTKHQPWQLVDCALRLSVACDEHIFKVATQKQRVDQQKGNGRADACKQQE